MTPMTSYWNQLVTICKKFSLKPSQNGHTNKKRRVAKALSLSILILMSVVIPFAVMSSASSASSTSGTSSTSNATSATTATSSLDYQLWVQPYLAKLEKIRAVLMTPYTVGNQHYGYDSTFGLIRGGNIEASPALGIGSGYQDVIVGIDNNLEGSYSLDYFNSAASPLVGQTGFSPVNTNVYGNVRALLSENWVGVGACTSPFNQYTYPSSFSLLERTEA